MGDCPGLSLQVCDSKREVAVLKGRFCTDTFQDAAFENWSDLTACQGMPPEAGRKTRGEFSPRIFGGSLALPTLIFVSGATDFRLLILGFKENTF